MAGKAAIAKNKKKQAMIAQGKLSAVRHRNRCGKCGRPRSYNRRFGMCRICFRELANAGKIPGVVKASW